MARFVRISTIAAAAPALAGREEQAAVDHIVDYWRTRIDRVLPDRPDLIVLPEACDGLMDLASDAGRELAVLRGDQLLCALQQIAADHQCWITCPTIHRLDDGTWRNSTQLIDRRGRVAGTYNKNHPTEGELEAGILAGASAPLFETEFGRIGAAICFDLNFDKLRLNYAARRPDLILFSSVYHGGLMQAYWAYSCRCHFVSAIGGAGNTPSHIISPIGQTLASTTNYRDFVTATVNLDCCIVHLDFHGDKLAAIKSKFGREVHIDDPGRLGSVLISSESEERTVRDIAAEFELTLLDDYFERALKAQALSSE